MMISAHILSIPPYLSTAWKNISSLHAIPEQDRFKLIVILNSGVNVTIAALDKASIDSIFEAHARYSAPPEPTQVPATAFTFPLTGNLDLMTSALQHNPAQANSPELPKELLEKIAAITKVLGFDDAAHLPKAEPHCNCPFCQIARAFNAHETVVEEKISDKDLQFRSWDIQQTADKLYNVANPINEKEHYSVYLGEPLGCTCGQKNCEHIRAVLNS